jgi:hypothetical protein
MVELGTVLDHQKNHKRNKIRKKMMMRLVQDPKIQV